MARTITMGADWMAVMRPWPRTAFRFGPRFSIELAPDVIVTPLLHGDVRQPGHGYTIPPPRLLVMHARGDEHLDAVRRMICRSSAVPAAFILDADRGDVMVVRGGVPSETCDVARLPALVADAARIEEHGGDRDALVAELTHAFEEMATGAEAADALASAPIRARCEEAAARAERAPLRLWEAMFWRGYNYRWELVDGEVPLVGELWSPLAANRTLLQCVADAEHVFSVRADEAAGWITCGPVRMRQRHTRVEIWIRLCLADRRAAFMPAAEAPGDDAHPTLFGALLAGGPNGKTELIEGYSESVVIVHPDRDPSAVARDLAEDIRRFSGATVVEHPFGEDCSTEPEPRDSRWRVRHWDGHVSVRTPMHRADRLPWDIHAGLHLSDDFAVFRARRFMA